MTIAEIAKLAGVSKACVSRYLNHGYVSEEKKRKIQTVIDATGYVPSRQAQILRTGKSRLVGVILPKINSESIGGMVAGISSALGDRGFGILLANTENNVEKELRYLELFQQGQVEGVIFLGTLLTPRHRQILQNYPVPVVVLSQQVDYLSCVYNNDHDAAREITRELLDSGRKHVGYIGVTNRDRAVGAARRAGFLEALRERGIEIADEHMIVTGFTLEDGNAAAQQLFERAPKVDAVFCATDTLAVGAMQYIKGVGKRIPEDVAVIGCNNSVYCTICYPQLSSIDNSLHETGRTAAQQMIRLLNHEPDVEKTVCLPCRLVLRDTTPPMV